MSTIEKTQSAIQLLSPEEYEQLRQWFFERDWEAWDKQIEQDSEAGKLDFLVEEAISQKTKDQLKEL